MIGEDGSSIWLVTVDGRQPWLSLGMSFKELQELADETGLRAAEEVSRSTRRPWRR